MQEQKNAVISTLTIENMVFDNMTFHRLGFRNDRNEDIHYQVAKNVEKRGEGKYQVMLAVKVEKPDEYKMEVQQSAFCVVDEEAPNKEILLNENAIAIMMPYMRAQISLLTSQPDTVPLVMPVLNVHEMVKEMDTPKEE